MIMLASLRLMLFSSILCFSILFYFVNSAFFRAFLGFVILVDVIVFGLEGLSEAVIVALGLQGCGGFWIAFSRL